MKIHLKFDESDPKDTLFTVVIDDTPCGQLSMMTEDAVRMADIFKSGCSQHQCAFELSGELYKSESWVIWRKRSGKERRSGQERRKGGDRRTVEDRRK
ncbi:MAG: hypothetical protein WBG61_03475 [Desulfobacterales bacterium]